MKILFIMLALSVSLPSRAVPSEAPEFLCSLANLKRIKTIAVAHSSFDKNRHCSVSCMLTLKCSALEVISVGLIKEITDFYGAGIADIEDLEADAFGIDLVLQNRAHSETECLLQCDQYYP